MAFAALAMSTSAFAQQDINNKPANSVSFENDPTSSHWFLEIGDAATLSTLPNVSGPKFTDRLSYINPTLALGKWHNPYFATRLKVMGGQQYQFTKYYNRAGDMFANPNELSKNKLTYVNASYDFMFDVVNYFTTYREDRVFHVIPYLGVGLGYVGKVDMKKESYDRNVLLPLVNGGIQFKFRLAKIVDLNLEVASTATTETRFTDKVRVNREDFKKYRMGLLSSAQIGLTFHLGKKEFTPVTPMDYALIDDLNNTLNSLRAENAELSKRPESCPECPEVVETEDVVIGNVVYFRINSAKIDKNQIINVYNTAQWIKNNTGNIILVGYADRDTGTSAYNMKLSQRRAEAVKDMLVKKFGISADRIKTSWEGSDVQPYSQNDWNRVVIMNSKLNK